MATSRQRVLGAGLSLMVLVALAIGMIGAPPANAASLGSIQNVSRDAAQSVVPRSAQDPQGNIHIVWDSAEDVRRVRYAKGTWNGSNYAFGSSFVVADVGSYQYSTPNIAVAPDGTVLVAWSDGEIRVRSWNSRDDRPGGGTSGLGSGIQPSIAPDRANRFHIVWNGDFQVQYCMWNGSSCQNRDSFSRNASNRPDVAVDSNDGVHLVWDRGQGVSYRARPANAGWGDIQDLGAGNFAQIAADRAGSVHIAWSRDFNIQYCRRTLGGGCADNRTISVGDDVQPTIGVTPEGRVLVAFRASNQIYYDVREGGAWAGPKAIAGGAMVYVSPRPYNERLSVVWSGDFDIQHVTVTAGVAPAPSPTAPAPTPTPGPTTPPAPPTGTFDFANVAFRDLWTRTDSLVQQGAVSYSWLWGPSAFSSGVNEYYVQSPGQSRLVQYFDKSRMEINQPGAARGPFYVTNGRLADELITGLMQTGDAQYEQRTAARVAVAGDPQNEFPHYRDLQAVYRRQRPGDRANEILYRASDGSIKTDLLPSANNDPSMVITQRVAGLGIPKIFWDFMNRPGRVVENGAVVNADPFFDWRYVVGEPLTEAYWTTVKVGGVDRGVLVQAFERRVLTYTPTNPPAFHVEMGNIGRHYFEWRYGVRPR